MFKMKFSIQTNSNILMLMVMFLFLVLDQKQPFWVNFVKKIKIVWYIDKYLFEYAEFDDIVDFSCFGPEIPFWGEIWSGKTSLFV